MLVASSFPGFEFPEFGASGGFKAACLLSKSMPFHQFSSVLEMVNPFKRKGDTPHGSSTKYVKLVHESDGTLERG